MKATINSGTVFIKPSKQLMQHISNLKKYDDMPAAFISIRKKKPFTAHDPKLDHPANLITNEDRKFMETLNLQPTTLDAYDDDNPDQNQKHLLNLEDLLWLWNKIQEENHNSSKLEKFYIHELLMGSEIILPQNTEIPRSEELDKRCQLLRNQQENRAYKAMTKNVDNVRKPHPEDTISYQIKQINKQLIAVAQFIISVLAGFAFGFQGIEFMVGSLDFGFRLLLGVICSLIIALAELYFLAKKLNEDLQYEIKVENKTAHAKID